MITKVYNVAGVLIHDCGQNRCDVSWDGVVVATGLDDQGKAPIPGTYTVDQGAGTARLNP